MTIETTLVLNAATTLGPWARIKPLDWTKHPKSDFWRAFTLVGVYGVSDVNGGVTWSFDPFDGTQSRISVAVETVAKAMGCAQDHFAKAILSGFDLGQPTALGSWSKTKPLEWSANARTHSTWRAWTFIGIYEASAKTSPAIWSFSPSHPSLVAASGKAEDGQTARDAAEAHYAATLLLLPHAMPASEEWGLIERLYRAGEDLENEGTGAGQACFEAIRLLILKDQELNALREGENPDREPSV